MEEGYNFLQKRSNRGLFEVLKNCLSMGELENFRFLFKIYRMKNQLKADQFLSDLFKMLRREGEPAHTFVLSEQCPSSSHFSWFIMKMIKEIPDFKFQVTIIDEVLCHFDLIIADLLITDTGYKSQELDSNLHLIQKSFMTMRDIVFRFFESSDLNMPPPPLRIIRFYDFYPSRKQSLFLDLQSFGSYFLTLGCSYDQQDEQLFPLLSFSVLKLKQYFSLLNFMTTGILYGLLHSNTLYIKLLVMLEAHTWDCIFRLCCENFLYESQSDMLVYLRYLDLSYYKHLSTFANFEPDQLRLNLIKCLLHHSVVLSNKENTDKFHMIKLRIHNEVDQLLWDSRTNGSARALVCDKYAITNWTTQSSEEKVQDKRVKGKGQIRVKSMVDREAIVEAIIESKELCRAYCLKVEFKVMQMELGNGQGEMDELPIFVKYYLAVCQKSANTEVISFNTPTDKINLVKLITQNSKISLYQGSLDRKLRLQVFLDHFLEFLLNSKEIYHFLELIYNKSISSIKQSGGDFKNALYYTNPFPELKTVIVITIWEEQYVKKDFHLKSNLIKFAKNEMGSAYGTRSSKQPDINLNAMIQQLDSTLQLSLLISQQLNQQHSVKTQSPQDLFDLLTQPTNSWPYVLFMQLHFPLHALTPHLMTTFTQSYLQDILLPLKDNLCLKSVLAQDLHLFQAFIVVKLLSDIIIGGQSNQLDSYIEAIEWQLRDIRVKRELSEKTLGVMISMILGSLSNSENLHENKLVLRLIVLILPHLSISQSFKDLSHLISLRVQVYLSQQILTKELGAVPNSNPSLRDYLLAPMNEISKILLQTQNLPLVKAFLECSQVKDSWIHQEYEILIRLAQHDNQSIDSILGYNTKSFDSLTSLQNQDQQLRKLENELMSHLGSNKTIREIMLETRNIQHSQIGGGGTNNSSNQKTNHSILHQGQIQKTRQENGEEDGRSEQMQQQVTVLQQKQALIALIDSQNQESQWGLKEFQSNLISYLNLGTANQKGQPGKSNEGYLYTFLSHLKMLLDLIGECRQQFEPLKGQRAVKDIINSYTLDEILKFLMNLHNEDEKAATDNFQYLRLALDLKLLAKFDILHLLSYLDCIPTASNQFTDLLSSYVKPTDFSALLPYTISQDRQQLLLSLIESTHSKDSTPFYQALCFPSKIEPFSDSKSLNQATLLESSLNTLAMDQITDQLLYENSQQKPLHQSSRVESYLKKQKQRRFLGEKQKSLEIKDYSKENMIVGDAIGLYKLEREASEALVIETLVEKGILKGDDQYRSDIEVDQTIIDAMICHCQKIKGSEFKSIVKDQEQFYIFIAAKLLKDTQVSLIEVLVDTELSEKDVQEVYKTLRKQESYDSFLIAQSLLSHHQQVHDEKVTTESDFMKTLGLLTAQKCLQYWHNLQINDNDDLIKSLIINLDLKSLSTILKIQPSLQNIQYVKSFVKDSCMLMSNSSILLDLLDIVITNQHQLEIFLSEELCPQLFKQLPTLLILPAHQTTQIYCQTTANLHSLNSSILRRYPQFALPQCHSIDMHFKLNQALASFKMDQEEPVVITEETKWIDIAKILSKQNSSAQIFEQLQYISREILKDQELQSYVTYLEIKEKITQGNFREAIAQYKSVADNEGQEISREYIEKLLQVLLKHKEKKDTRIFLSKEVREIKASYIALKHLYNTKNLEVERMVSSEFIRLRKDQQSNNEHGIQLIQKTNEPQNGYRFEYISKNKEEEANKLERLLLQTVGFYD